VLQHLSHQRKRTATTYLFDLLRCPEKSLQLRALLLLFDPVKLKEKLQSKSGVNVLYILPLECVFVEFSVDLQLSLCLHVSTEELDELLDVLLGDGHGQHERGLVVVELRAFEEEVSAVEIEIELILGVFLAQKGLESLALEHSVA
jgi:hypothetical protein